RLASAVQVRPWPPQFFKYLAQFFSRKRASVESKWSPNSVVIRIAPSRLLAPLAPLTRGSHRPHKLLNSESLGIKISLPFRFPSFRFPKARGGRLSCFLPGAPQRKFRGSEASRHCGAAARRLRVARRCFRGVSRYRPACRRVARACRLRPGT